jgi:hypothetical protein
MKNRILNKGFSLFFLCVAAIVCMGCGTLAGRSKSAMGIQAESLTSGVAFEIVDGKGTVVANGVTPAVVTLPNGVFGTNKYTIRYTDKNGQAAEQTVKCTLDTSVLFATVRGFATVYSFFVDPFTGALFKLPDVATLQEISYSPDIQLIIASIDDVRPEMRQYLIPGGFLELE